jgi:hypothetical protein
VHYPRTLFGLIPTLTLLANSPKRPMGTILEHNRGHWV